ncbi:MAG: hypothetical protein WCH85_00130 [Methanomicrobiales archaeon]
MYGQATHRHGDVNGAYVLPEEPLLDGFVLRVREGMGRRVVPGILQLAIPILAGSCLDRDVHIALVFWRGLSWRHNE